MNRETIRLIDLYPYRLKGNRVEFLLLRRSAGKIYEGSWRMVGGKVGEEETGWQAALRELHEETGLVPECFWCVPTINHFYEAGRDQVHMIPVFAAEIRPGSDPLLDDEHDDYRWLEADETVELLQWPEQRRIVRLISNLIEKGEVIQEWIIEDRRS